ncbi:MAG: hypothetical protein ACREUS_10620 [Burkholderiales bacterium]
MRNEFRTPFWQNAYESLPTQVRAQYLTQIKAAERWELALGDLLQAWSRVKNAVVKLLRRPSESEASSSSSG